MTVFLRIIEPPVHEKATVLLRAIESIRGGKSDDQSRIVVFERSPSVFATVPGAPFAYWVSEALREVFRRMERLEANGRIVKQGLATRDDFRFVRAWWEIRTRIPEGDPKWPLFAKGGAFSSFYADVCLAVRWDDEAQAAYEERTSNFNVLLTSSRDEFLYRAGLTWPRRTNGLSFRAMPQGCVFADKGPVAFVQGDSPMSLSGLAAVVNSKPFGYLMAVQLARTELAQSYEVGLVQQTPVPTREQIDRVELPRLARRAWSLKRSLDTVNESSHAFLLPPGLNAKITGLAPDSVVRELESVQKQIDDASFDLYGIGPEDRAVIEASFQRSGNHSTEEADVDDADDSNDDENSVGEANDAMLSWLVGVAFGRFDPRLATGERRLPAEPEPFAPLPARSPGMYPEPDEPAGSPDILVDDEGHADDLTARVRGIAEQVQVDVPETLRSWLGREFFPLHIKMYSKSRRKAPIYWQLATPSANYSVWLYVSAFSKDTLFRVQNDYAARKLAHEERRLESLSNELRDGATAAQRRQLAAQEAVVEELRAFLAEVKRVAPLWKPNLDDGVIINFAPLWRLVPQHKSWQKELKTTWDALCEGKYDWAHLAMHLWPERVVPACAKDRSLAIAHGLEDVFWVEGTDGKWTPRKTPTKSVDEVVKKRTSTAVKSALKSLLEAPTASGTATKPKKVPRKGNAHA
jgi:hypothetical protein